MKKNRRTNPLAAVALVGASWLFHVGRAQAQYIVSGPMNTAQSTITAGSHVMSYLEQGKQYEIQAQQYATQFRQYQMDLQNVQALGQFKWSDASTSLNQLVGTVNGTTNAYNAFLSQFQTQTQWNQHPPTPATYRQSTAAASSTEIASYAAAVQNLSTQNANMARDAAVLSKMTASAQGASGELQALQAGMQLASAQVHQLQEVRLCWSTSPTPPPRATPAWRTAKPPKLPPRRKVCRGTQADTPRRPSTFQCDDELPCRHETPSTAGSLPPRVGRLGCFRL